MAEKEGFGFRASASPLSRSTLRSAACHENAGRENASPARFLVPPVQIPYAYTPSKRRDLVFGHRHRLFRVPRFIRRPATKTQGGKTRHWRVFLFRPFKSLLHIRQAKGHPVGMPFYLAEKDDLTYCLHLQGLLSITYLSEEYRSPPTKASCGTILQIRLSELLSDVVGAGTRLHPWGGYAALWMPVS